MASLFSTRYSILLVAFLDFCLLHSTPTVAGMMGGMGHHKHGGGGGSSNVEAMLVAGILAKLLSGAKNEKEQMHPPMIMPMPMPIMMHHMSHPTMMNLHAHMPSMPSMPHMPTSMGYSSMGGMGMGMGGGYGAGQSMMY